MKRTVKSASDLRRLALQQGAEVTVAGGRFNSSMERAPVERQMPPPPPPPVAPEPALAPATPPATVLQQHTEQVQVNLDMQPVADAVDRGNERVAAVIEERLRSLSVPTKSSSPTSWFFKINRDTRGFIESVEATPKQ